MKERRAGTAGNWAASKTRAITFRIDFWAYAVKMYWMQIKLCQEAIAVKERLEVCLGDATWASWREPPAL